MPATNPPAAISVEARWLTDAERAAWLTLAALMVKVPFALDTQLQRDSGLSYFEYMVLAFLSEQSGHLMRMSDLAVSTNGSLSRLSHVAKRLENQGLLRREPSPEDGRYTNAILTGPGYDRVVAAAPGHVAAVRAVVIDALNPEQLDQLRQIDRQILQKMDPTAGW